MEKTELCLTYLLLYLFVLFTYNIHLKNERFLHKKKAHFSEYLKY